MAAISNFAYVDTLRNTIKLNGNAPSIEEEIGELMGLVIDTSKNDFQFLNISESRLDSQYYYERYQQLYQGIPVSGGGYSNLIIHPDGHPCPRSVLLFPYVYTDIDVDTSNIYSESGVLQAFVDSINFQAHTVELLVEYNLLGQCNFDLVFEVHYFTDKSYVAWVDAHTLDVLLIQPSDKYANAPTEDYGTQFMRDSDINQNEAWLVSDNGVFTYNANTFPVGGYPTGPLDPEDYDDVWIPTRLIIDEWTPADAPGSVFQAHWFTVQAVDAYFEELEIEYGEVHVAANWPKQSARSLYESTMEEGFIALGRMHTSPLSTYAEVDIISHELAHIYMNDIFEYKGTTASVEEGVADMFGTFIESILEGLDWVIGDNIPRIIRDLENPQFDCFTDVEQLGYDDRHLRSTPLGHWFFLVSDECEDIDFAINLVLDALNSVPSDADYPDLMNSTLAVIGEILGSCSPPMQCVAARWEEICVNTGYDPAECSNTDITGPYQICEEDNLGTFCVQNNLGATHHRFTLVGKKSTHFTTVAGMQGNSQSGSSSCFVINHIPTLPYYPQYYDLYYLGTGTNVRYRARKQMKVNDCLEDDLTCDEYYYPNSMISGINELIQVKREISTYKIYDITGRLIFSGPFDQEIKFYDSGVYILLFFDDKGHWISTQKKLIIR